MDRNFWVVASRCFIGSSDVIAIADDGKREDVERGVRSIMAMDEALQMKHNGDGRRGVADEAKGEGVLREASKVGCFHAN